MKSPINIAIADDHELVVQGFVELLTKNPDLKILFTANNGKDLLDKLKENSPQIILLDLDMPVLSGEEAFDKIKKRFPKIKIIIISATYRPAIIMQYVKKGAGSFLHKNCSREDLIRTIKGVEEYGEFFDEKVLKILAKELASPTAIERKVYFSEIELEVLKLMCEGLTIKEIGVKLNIDTRSAEWHKSQMMLKINTNSSNVLTYYAAKHNLV